MKDMKEEVVDKKSASTPDALRLHTTRRSRTTYFNDSCKKAANNAPINGPTTGIQA